jgi:hypothetical protein
LAPRSAPCALNLSIIFGANSTIAIPTSVGRRLVKWLPVSLRVLQPLVPRVYPLLPSLPFLTLLLNPYLNPYLNPLSETFLRPIPTSVVIQPQTIIKATHGFRPGLAEAR